MTDPTPYERGRRVRSEEYERLCALCEESGLLVYLEATPIRGTRLTNFALRIVHPGLNGACYASVRTENLASQLDQMAARSFAAISREGWFQR